MPPIGHHVGMDSNRNRLLGLVSARRAEAGLSRQVDLVRATGLSKSTIHRFERGGSIDESSMRDISRAIGWTADSAADVLAGGQPTLASDYEAERREWRESFTEEELSGLIRNIVYDAVISTAPDTPLSRIREIEEMALESAYKVGFGVRRKRIAAHSDSDPEN